MKKIIQWSITSLLLISLTGCYYPAPVAAPPPAYYPPAAEYYPPPVYAAPAYYAPAPVYPTVVGGGFYIGGGGHGHWH